MVNERLRIELHSDESRGTSISGRSSPAQGTQFCLVAHACQAGNDDVAADDRCRATAEAEEQKNEL